MNLFTTSNNILENASIKSHVGWISDLLKLSNDRFASYWIDKTIKIFNTKNYNCDITIIVHIQGISSIGQLDNGQEIFQ